MKIVELLIEHVRANPVLYDSTNREYRNQNARKEAWDEIGEKLGMPGNDCKEAWSKLQNAFSQVKHRRATKSGLAAKNLPKLKFGTEMAFLNPTLISRQMCGNVDNTSTENHPETANTAIGIEAEEDTAPRMDSL
ncbi:uncharacterized protein LOC128894773 [Hylaeus anthracinus]|uniref:uncharacterized protein LOC128894773 n=1 Tax=Hylaeus anthracinus TaxID=313031 RepID=UPI0023B9DA69|nr:uncharacterized protein LOC128894773 [Hylaeus anthracinus]